MRRTALALFTLLSITTLSATALAGPPKPGKKCEVAAEGAGADAGTSGLGWSLAGAALAAVAVARRRQRQAA
jgi:hypothetical protein